MKTALVIFVALYLFNVTFTCVCLLAIWHPTTLELIGEKRPPKIPFREMLSISIIRPWSGLLYFGAFLAGYIRGRFGK